MFKLPGIMLASTLLTFMSYVLMAGGGFTWS